MCGTVAAPDPERLQLLPPQPPPHRMANASTTGKDLGAKRWGEKLLREAEKAVNRPSSSAIVSERGFFLKNKNQKTPTTRYPSFLLPVPLYPTSLLPLTLYGYFQSAGYLFCLLAFHWFYLNNAILELILQHSSVIF